MCQCVVCNCSDVLLCVFAVVCNHDDAGRELHGAGGGVGAGGPARPRLGEAAEEGTSGSPMIKLVFFLYKPVWGNFN